MRAFVACVCCVRLLRALLRVACACCVLRVACCVLERFFWGVSRNHQGGTCKNLLKIVAINESRHLGSEKSPPYGRAQRLTRPKCAFLGKIIRHIKKFFGRFQREERNEK